MLHNILPRPIANRLKAGEQRIADTFDSVTVLFADIEGFTKMSETVGPHTTLERLNHVFSTMDRLSEKYQLEKIKTIGDAYMVVGGMPLVREDHTEAVADMALEIQAKLEGLNRKIGSNIRVRCGMHRGEVIAGVMVYISLPMIYGAIPSTRRAAWSPLESPERFNAPATCTFV